ncbi:phosphoinositide 3-kinase adapter protein 1 isoform X1 [Anarrhichthys ocellatus]|uniref:phosphoinositide 3-kinase adapter protein 1 isoform X1 n=1 Tax=Anarrhichthys ocellatus TaxID=433405 RepID=UPI0012EED2B8|nr:phosphoinositide 3-kinase adapter protein 1 isoform X1 [Anarrhichthys ocellatus]
MSNIFQFYCFGGAKLNARTVHTNRAIFCFSAEPESPSAHELLILHAAEAAEWATYLQQILKSSRKFRKRSVVLYAVDPADQLLGHDFDCFQSCECVVLLLTGVILDMLCDPELQAALRGLLHPPHRVVALLCGVPEDDVTTECLEDWPSWRKLYADDEPALYVSTILESITDSRRVEAEHKIKAVAAAEVHITAASLTEDPATDETGVVVSDEQQEPVLEDGEPVLEDGEPVLEDGEPVLEDGEPVLEDGEPASTPNSTGEELSTPTHLTCLTVQPSRVLCGEREKLFIIFTHKVDDWSVPEVEFSFGNVAAKRVPGTVENDYTISVTAPDMPAGVVSLTMYSDQCCVSLRPVTYYTNMGEVSRYLEDAADPVNFICQAFNLTSNATESLDNMLTDSLKSMMPATGLQVFGIRQIEEDNMTAYQRNEELPTLLHFAAKYGLKKLTTILLQCPGALQAYSVMNKSGDYPNTLAEKSGFLDLRQFMDEFVEPADMLKSHIEDSIHTEEGAEVYELMTPNSQDMMMKYSGCSEDIYESMLVIDPECAEDLYEVMIAVDKNPEEAMLRKFFQAKPPASVNQDNTDHLISEEEEKGSHTDFDEIEEEEDPYNLCPEDIYDTVDANGSFNPLILNRPPAPIPRPESMADLEKPQTYISRVFSDKAASQSTAMEAGCPAAQPAAAPLSPTYDPYAGMKTPGQRQLISLQERVKVGEITVDEAVQEFKTWQFDHERRSSSIRYQQENLKRLRDSITRRHKEREKAGKELDYEISAPLQRNLYWGPNVTLECSLYKSTPRMVAPLPPVPQSIQRGSWKTGSTSSTSSTESNRLSTFSYSSGTEPDFEDMIDAPPPRPPRPSVASPRIPPRVPERVSETHERYISCPTRALPQRPTQRHTNAAPPVPRRLR